MLEQQRIEDGDERPASGFGTRDHKTFWL